MTLSNRTTAAALLLLATPASLAAADSESGGLFSVNPGLTIWTFFVFLALLGILWRFAWGPILASVSALHEQRPRRGSDPRQSARGCRAGRGRRRTSRW